MPTITDFAEWISKLEIDSLDEVLAIYSAAKYGGDFAICNAESAGEKTILTCPNSDLKLLLASQKAKDSFLNYLNTKYGDSELDFESFHSLQKSIQKKD